MEECLVGTSYRILFRRTSGCDPADIRKSEIWRENKNSLAPALCLGLYAAKLWGDQIIGLFFGLTW